MSSLIHRHATHMKVNQALGRPILSYQQWLETMLTATEDILTIERETNERLSELVLDLSRDNARLEAELANAAVIAGSEAAL